MAGPGWKAPPLAIAVAGLHYDRLLAFDDDVLPKLQSALRPVFPGYESENVEVMHHTKIAQINVSQTRHVFRTKDGTAAIIVGDQGFLVLTSRYESFEAFLPALLVPALEALLKAIPSGPLLVRRYGLRYVDRVLPKSGETPEHYLSSHLRHDIADHIPGSSRSKMGMSLARCEMKEGFLDVRFLTGLGRPPLPSDLMPSPVLDDMPRGVDEIPSDTRTAVIDTDRFIDVAEELSVDQARTRYGTLHEDISDTFKATVTRFALEAWGCPSIGK